MSSTKFISNEDGQTLQQRFALRIKNTQFFDVLVGYFYSSGFKAIYPSLENTEKIRILIGISTDYQTFKAVQSVKMSHTEVADKFSELVKDELEGSEDTIDTEESINKFKEWLLEGRIEIRAYPDEKIHSKIYIMTADEKTRSFTKGSVITGSSNFTESGLRGNIEFNVELKDESDYDYALERFEALWEKGVDLSERYVQTINQDTWLKDDITPYELYLKFLYEYFIDDINEMENLEDKDKPENFMRLKYQEDAVLNAKRILNQYNGVFISDVVGLGKTYMGTMLCQLLDSPTLIIAPPHLIAEENPGSWENAFTEFGFKSKEYKCISRGLIDQIVKNREYEKFKNILIDESHYYRNDNTQSFSELMTICKDKKVILVTATPYNNKPDDLLNQIKLFQAVRNSTIPNLFNIERFFKSLEKNLKVINKDKEPKKYMEQVRSNALQIRERLLKYIMVRRTRQEIQTYYADDLKAENKKFPKINDPQPILYQFEEDESITFDKTLNTLITDFHYARYRPLDYLKDKKSISGEDITRQKNITGFMKTLLIKRLESSYYAFKKTMERLIVSYDNFIKQYESGTVYISKKYLKKVLNHVEDGNFEEIDKMIERGEVEEYKSSEFSEKFIDHLKNDLVSCKEILFNWENILTDSKIKTFKDFLSNNKVIKNNKYIIFTESKETCEYLKSELDKFLEGGVLNFSGDKSSHEARKLVLDNFDNNAKNRKDEFKVLITTDVLAEGVSLHRCNTVINYDIPWNPTKIMQRVGRINRIDTPFDNLYTFNFFPTDKADTELGLRNNASKKVSEFISLLGTDAKLLTEDEEIEAHSLFDRLNSREALEGIEIEGLDELGYLKEIRAVRDENIELFEKIKKLPKKCRAVRTSSNKGLLTFLRKGDLKKFYFTDKEKNTDEKVFSDAAKMLKAEITEEKGKFNSDYFELLSLNKEELDKFIAENDQEVFIKPSGQDSLVKLKNHLLTKEIKNYEGFTPNEKSYINKIIEEANDGKISKVDAKKANKAFEKYYTEPVRFLNELKKIIPEDRLSQEKVFSSIDSKIKEVILSEYFS